MCHMNAVRQGPDEDSGFPGPGALIVCELSRGCEDPNLGPLEEQTVILIVQSPLQPLQKLFKSQEVRAFSPSTWEAETGRSLNSRSAWSTKQVPGQPGLHRETLSGVGVTLRIDSFKC